MSAFFTTYALGSSPASSSGMPITAASATAGLVSNTASSSAGGTYNLIHKIVNIINSYYESHGCGS